MASARLILLPLALTLLILSPTILAYQPFFRSGQSSDQPRRLQRGQQTQNDCQIDKLSATEPSIRYEDEAGVTEMWDTNEQQEFQCAGVTVIRREVQPKGLVLPHYANAPSITYVLRGKGLLGMINPGCPETYESGSYSSSGESRRSERGTESQSQTDRHQKVRRFYQGHIMTSPAGTAKWVYNDGDDTLTYITMFDTNNYQNQLDDIVRNFFLAGGNPLQNEKHQGHHHESGHGRHSRGSDERESEDRRSRGSHDNQGHNVFSGLDGDILSEIYEVKRDTIEKLQGKNDKRGAIVHVEGDSLDLSIPEYSQEEQRSERSHHGGGGRGNGIEETICSAQFNENIDNPEKADVFNPQGGRLTSLNSRKLPILSYLRLGAERVNLYQNAIFAPNWKINAHSIVYFTKGSGRVQVASNEGRLVFDDMVQEGQLLVIPQNFVVLKKADRDGLEWVSFLTNDQPMNSPLAGRISAIRGMPEEVVMNSYGLSREEARRLKYGRQELSVFSPSHESQRKERYAIV